MLDALAGPPAEAALVEAVNAFVDGNDVLFLTRRPDGTLAERRARAEYVSFVAKDEIPADKLALLRQSPYALSVREDGAYWRVRWRSRGDRYAVHDDWGRIGPLGVPSYEGDVSPVGRIISDLGIKIQAPRRAYLDIETDSRVPITRALEGEARILSWAVTDQHGNGEAFVLDDDTDMAEQELLGALYEVLAPYDQVVAWFGDGFDFPVIDKRTAWHRLRADRRRWLWLDHLETFKKQNKTGAKSGDEKQSMKLDAIAQRLLGVGKNRFDSSRTWDAWARGSARGAGANREDLLAYNVQDTALLPPIEAKTGFLEMLDVTCQVCNIFPNSLALKSTRQLDGYMLRIGAQKGRRFKTRPRGVEESDEQYPGAYVMEPSFKGDGHTGIVRDVHAADFASLYPSIIVTFNMSPETKTPVPVNGPIPAGRCRSPATGTGFRTDVTGFLAEAVSDVLVHRAKWKKEMLRHPPGSDAYVNAKRLSDAFKVIANSFYGVIGSEYSRFYDVSIATSITQTGKWLIEQVIGEAQQRGMDPGYADTDSCLVAGCSRADFERLVDDLNKVVFPRLIAEHGCAKNTIKLAYDKQFSRIVFLAKKRYVGVYEHVDGITATPLADGLLPAEVKGLEYKRGDAIRFARVLQTRMIDLFRAGEMDHRKYAEIVSLAREAVRHMPLAIEDVQITKSVKPLKEYKQKKKKDGTDAAQPPQVVIAKMLQARGAGTGEGGRVSYVVLDASSKPRKLLPADDFKGEVDRRYLWNDLTYAPTKRLLEKMFPGQNWGVYEIKKPRTAKKGGGEFVLELFAAPVDAIARGSEILGVAKPGDEQDDFDDEMEDGEEDQDAAAQ